MYFLKSMITVRTQQLEVKSLLKDERFLTYCTHKIRELIEMHTFSVQFGQWKTLPKLAFKFSLEILNPYYEK